MNIDKLPRFANIKEFVAHGLAFQAYPMQLQVLAELFGEVCWECTDPVFHTRPWVQHDMNHSVYWLRNGKCDHCGKTREELLSAKYDNYATHGYYTIGQRAGSTLMAAIASLYTEHRMLTLRIDGKHVTPNQYFDLRKPGIMLHQFLVCTTMEEAQSTWEAREMLRKQSPWYQEHDAILYNQASISNDRMVCAIQESTRSRIYHHMGLETRAISAANVNRDIRGTTTYFALVSNAHWMSDFDKLIGTLTECQRFVQTRAEALFRCGRANVLNPCVLAMSARNNVKDRLFREHHRKRYNKFATVRMQSRVIPSWDMRPDMDRASFNRASGHEPEAFVRDFGCSLVGDADQLFDDFEAYMKERNFEE